MKRTYILVVFSLLLSLPSAVAATVVVDTLTDVRDGDTSSIAALLAAPGADGAISLREAIEAANATAGPDRVEFSVSGIISPTSELPVLSDTTGGTTIDGGGSVRIDGSAAPEDTDGLHVTSANNEIIGLMVTRFPGLGIVIHGKDAHHNRVAGCKIGTDGINKLGNTKGPGIQITEDARHNLVGGRSEAERNNISDNYCCGVHLDHGGDFNTVIGNYIGIADDGITALINIGIAVPDEWFTSVGVIMIYGGSDNTIGGAAPGEGNLISANHVNGVWIASEESRHNTVRGNRFLHDPTAQMDYGFDYYPYIASAINCNAGSSGNIIGGCQPGEGNIVEGYWEHWGIHIRYSHDNIVQGNVLHDGPAHLLYLNRAGIAVDHSTGNLIGGAQPGAGNVVLGRFDAVGIRMHPNNVARGNSVTANDKQAILVDGEGIAPPVVLGLAPLHGTAPACSLVDFYADEEDEARVYLGAVRADACGRFVTGLDLSGSLGLNLTATVTEEFDWTTSELCTPIPIDEASLIPGEGEVFPYDPHCYCAEEVHSADYDGDGAIGMSELLRIIQLFSSDDGFHCDPGTEDGLALGDGPRDCAHGLDYNPRDWHIGISELLRGIQFYNMGAYARCEPSEDGYCAEYGEGESG